MNVTNTIQYIPVGDIQPNKDNPRVIQDSGFQKLKESLSGERGKDLFESRPCIVSTRTGEQIIIAGNTRYKAACELGWTHVPSVVLTDLTEQQEKEIIIRDNVNNGEWDFEVLMKQYDIEELEMYGVEIESIETEIKDLQDEVYTAKVETPVYQPKGEEPSIETIIDTQKYSSLVEKIEKSKLSRAEKEFLKLSATRHIVFDYGDIAEFYCHQSEEMQQLMEESALVIIDLDSAIEQGFIKLTEQTQNLISTDYPEND